jgi:hypothetical protein
VSCCDSVEKQVERDEIAKTDCEHLLELTLEKQMMGVYDDR